MSIYENKEYLSKNETWHVEDSAWKAKQIFGLFDNNNINPQSLCEVGCGAGEILVQLQKILPGGKDVLFTGYDISPDVANLWQERKTDRVRFIREDFLETSDKYDMLLFIDIIEHIEDYLGFLRKIKDRGEYKIFNFPLEIFAIKALMGQKFVESRNQYGHLHYFNRDIVLAVLRDLGFEILDDFYAPGSIELAGISTSVSLSSRMLKLPRVLLSKISIDLTAKLLGGYSLFVLTK